MEGPKQLYFGECKLLFGGVSKISEFFIVVDQSKQLIGKTKSLILFYFINQFVQCQQLINKTENFKEMQILMIIRIGQNLKGRFYFHSIYQNAKIMVQVHNISPCAILALSFKLKQWYFFTIFRIGNILMVILDTIL